MHLWGCGTFTNCVDRFSRSGLERPGIGGKTPVGEKSKA
jgi:hypothetical protein